MQPKHLMKTICQIQLVGLLLLLCVLTSSNVFAVDPPVGVNSYEITLAWDANSEENIAGYKLYRGVVSGTYNFNIDVGNITQQKVSGLERDITYYFAVTAYNDKDEESDFSEEISYMLPDDGSDPEPAPLPVPASNWQSTTNCGTDASPSVLVYEAEAAELSESVQVGTDGDGVKYVFSATGNRGYITFTLDIPSTGKYIIEGRVNSHGSDGRDSFYIGFLPEAEIRVSRNIWDTSLENKFVWHTVRLRGPTGTHEKWDFDPMVWDLSEGSNKLLIAVRESNAWLDKIRIKKQ